MIPRSSPQPADLTQREVTLHLFDHAHEWRARANERIDLASALWADRRRTIEADPLRRILEAGPLHAVLGGRLSKATRWARVALPITSIGRGPVIDLEIRVAGRPAFLNSRADIAQFQTYRLKSLATSALLPWGPRLENAINSICMFTPNPWETVLNAHLKHDGTFENALLRYLDSWWNPPGRSDGSSPLSADMLFGWLNLTGDVTRLVRACTVADPASAAEHPVLALPQSPSLLGHPDKVQRWLEGLNKLLHAAVQLTDDQGRAQREREMAGELLHAYAEGGRHQQLIAKAVVPLDESFLIEVASKAPLQLEDASRNPKPHRRLMLGTNPTTIRQLVMFDDARSNYVSARVDDPNVEIEQHDSELWDEKHEQRPDVPEGARFTEEIFAFYDARRGRPRRVWVDLRMVLSESTRAANRVVWLLTATALVGFVIFTWHVFHAISGKQLSGGDVAVILIPTAVAAALLLVRDSSTLSAEINKRLHKTVAFLLAALWICTLIFYGLARIKLT